MNGIKFSNEDKQQFSFLVETVAMNRVDGTAVVTGNIHGSITTNDQVYILYPGSKVSIGRIDLIRDEAGDMVYNAADCEATITVSLLGAKVELIKYCLLATVAPQAVVDMNKPVQNPYLLGLSYEYDRLRSDNMYVNVLIYELCHSHFLVPFRMQEGEKLDGSGVVDMNEEQNVQYLSIHKPGNEEDKLFPVFTDIAALSKWEGVFAEGEKPHVMILSFPKAYAIVKNGHIGLGVNLYGPKNMFFPTEMLDQITAMEGYQREFGERTTQAMEGQKLEEGKIVVGIPPQTQEVKLMRDALVDIARGLDDVKRVDLLVKMDAKKEKSYLVVVDCPKSRGPEIFDLMDKVLVQYANELKVIDYIAMADAGFLSNILNKAMPVYTLSE